MKRILAALMGGFLLACTPEPVVLTQTEVFRNPGAQIASQTNVTAERMAGKWFVRQRFDSRLVPTTFELRVLPNGDLQRSIEVEVFMSDGMDRIDEILVLYKATGPGRWTPVDPPRHFADSEIWVMWMDFDDRTAAIGTPSGDFGWIMDKNPSGGADRIAAARDIMDWFGYNLSRLEEVSR